ncbi:uncharacterized protein TRAVEDRAFT_20773 [Trametes versicolor FP-101664 SS1]|uniref:uncharacterized protein n=1 Tax=Trametes versicolor (strain FP-101664) TaxID=717944 RepID=UPI00046231B9|nr:uncharacterized protein TRAVEDRAFT_20773 [Trametes versicolor FP-101664 SS1]EIW58919.1 hypothetical protein TRAVEDRAFT_20773 [Trametes versicolor FP-101664 SS1]
MSRGFSSCFSLLLLALSVAVTAGATPVVQARGNLLKLIERDQARVRNLRARANAKLNGLTLTDDAVVSVPVDNRVVDYVADVAVGTPSTTYSLLIDTGRSNTWVGAGKSFVQTSSSRQTADRVRWTSGGGMRGARRRTCARRHSKESGWGRAALG